MGDQRDGKAREGAVFALSLVVLGGVIGALTVILDFAVDWASATFSAHLWLVWLLPIAGFCSYGVYRGLGVDFSWSTARVMMAVRDGLSVPPRLVPAIISGTAFTILCGGSVGKEAAALQMGAGASSLFRRFLSERYRDLLAPAAMAAALGAMLSAPLAGVVFSFEALRRCPKSVDAVLGPVVATFIAWMVVEFAGVRFLETPPVPVAAGLPVGTLALSLLAGSAAGAFAWVFCKVLQAVRTALAKLGASLFALAVGGTAMALILGYADLFHYEGLYAFCGTGTAQITAALAGSETPWWAFSVKAALTLLTFAGGFKGGEIMPIFAIGACLGCTVSDAAISLIGVGLPFGATELPDFAMAPQMVPIAAMVAFFAACTNCPLTALLLVAELFGPLPLVLSAPAVAAAFAIARSVSLYPSSLPSR